MQLIYQRANSFVNKINEIYIETGIAKERVKNTFNKLIVATPHTKKIRSYHISFSDDGVLIQRYNDRCGFYEKLLMVTYGRVLYSTTGKYHVFNHDWNISVEFKPELEMFNSEFHSPENEFQLSCVYSTDEMFQNYVRSKMNELGLYSFYCSSTDLVNFTRIPKALRDLK